MNAWFYLIAAIVLEVAGTTAMKLSEGFTRTWPSVAMGVLYLLSLGALTLALKRFEMSMAYAIWSGVGTALITLVGFYLFEEPITTLKLFSIALIIAGVVGLHLGSQA
jgi:small multidrug resistance pump